MLSWIPTLSHGVEILLPPLAGDGMVLRRATMRDDVTYVPFRTIGADRVEASLWGEGGKRRLRGISVESLPGSAGETRNWRLNFDELQPRTPVDIQIEARARRGEKVESREREVWIRNVVIGEVWIMVLGTGAAVPHTPDQRKSVIDVLKDEGISVRLADGRRRSGAKGGVARTPDELRWEVVEPEDLANGDYPNLVPYFTRELARKVRNEANEKGRPLGIGLILWDGEAPVTGGRPGALRLREGNNAVTPANAAVLNATESATVRHRNLARDLKREGQPPPVVPPKPEVLQTEVTSGPLPGFLIEDVSGIVRTAPSRSQRP